MINQKIFLRRWICMAMILCTEVYLLANHQNAFAHNPAKIINQQLKDILCQNTMDLYFSGYAWHNRMAYRNKILNTKHYNELAWGGGIGRSLFNGHGNWQGLYAFMFLDSHRDLETVTGYAHLFTRRYNPNIKIGVGYSMLLTSRSDTFHYIPFPGLVPLLGIFIKQLSIKASYIPGRINHGNVLYLVGTYNFKT